MKDIFRMVPGVAAFAFSLASSAFCYEGVVPIEFRGFKSCYRVFNSRTEVIVVPESGGRLLVYSFDGKNVIYEDRTMDGLSLANQPKKFDPDGGRFDIGPEIGPIPKHPNMWTGKWTGRATGNRQVTLTSPVEEAIGLEVRREFRLDKNSSYLRVRQTMKNVSDKVTRFCFWTRTFTHTGGVGFLPINPESKFVRGWALYPLKGSNVAAPSDPYVTVRDGYFILRPGNGRKKFALDSSAGWLANFKDGLLFVKRFRYFPKGNYVDALGFTVELYHDDKRFELEPLSPEAVLKPGHSYAFDEHWWIIPWKEGNVVKFDPAAAEAVIHKYARKGSWLSGLWSRLRGR